MSGFFDVITATDIIYALAAALVITYLIRRLLAGYKFIGVYDNIQVDYDRKNISMILQSCYELFPRDIITFQGDTFKRGNQVQILTVGNREITGELVGANSENMICLLTAKHIIAHELSHILAIKQISAITQEERDGNQ